MFYVRQHSHVTQNLSHTVVMVRKKGWRFTCRHIGSIAVLGQRRQQFLHRQYQVRHRQQVLRRQHL